MRTRRVAAAMLLGTVACLSSALGETLSVGLSDIAMITGNVRNNNVARIVLHVDGQSSCRTPGSTSPNSHSPRF